MRLEPFTTGRLTLCHWRDALDQQRLRVQLERDLLSVLTPAVLAHLPPSLQTEQTSSAIKQWITHRALESDVFTITETANRQLIGLLILAAPQNDHHIHLGYLLAEPVWGQGYASEIIHGLVAQFTDQPIQLTAGVGRDNPASARVLEKTGFNQAADQPDKSITIYIWRGANDVP